MKRIYLLFLNFIFIIILSACFGKRDIDQLSLGLAFGLDKAENGIEVSAQILNPNVLGQNPIDQSPIVVVSQTGTTVLEAIRKMSDILTGKLFITHMQVLLFGEELAREGIEEYLHFFKMDPETQHIFDIFIVKGDTAKNVLKIQSTVTLISSLSLVQKVQLNQDVYGQVYDSTMNKVYNDIKSTGIDPAVTSVQIIGEVNQGNKKDNTLTSEPNTYTEAAEIAVFKKDKLVGYLTEEESIGYNHIMGNIKSTVVKTTLDNGNKITFEVYRTKMKKKLKLENNIPKFTFDYEIIGTLGENMSGFTPNTKEYHQLLSDAISKEKKLIMEKTFNKALKVYKSDIFGLGSIIYRQELEYWKKIEKDYDQIIKDIEIEVKVKTTIVRVRL